MTTMSRIRAVVLAFAFYTAHKGGKYSLYFSASSPSQAEDTRRRSLSSFNQEIDVAFTFRKDGRTEVREAKNILRSTILAAR
jgi:hypothetical protein